MPEVQYFQDEDALFLRVREDDYSTSTREVGRHRVIGYNDAQEIVWVSIRHVSEGVDLDMFTGPVFDYLLGKLAQLQIRVLTS